jgi:arsenite methyltransferase
MAKSLDVKKLENEVKAVYRDVAQAPDGEFHFEMGRSLAERLGYQSEELDWAPKEAIDSFAGVGYHFDLANLQKGEDVLDLGSGSGMDVFVAALHVGENGTVTGLDMTDSHRFCCILSLYQYADFGSS